MASNSTIAPGAWRLSALAGTVGAFVLAVAGAASAWAHPGDGEPAATATAPRAAGATDDEILAPPPTYQAGDVTVAERVGAGIPLDAAFRTQDGKRVTLREVMHGDLPAILTSNYWDCPMLCSVQLNGLTAALPKVGELGRSPDPGKDDMLFRVGSQYRIVTIDLEPGETLERAQQMRERYLERVPADQRAAARAGWTFLLAETPGDGTAIRRVADAVGFHYTYVKDRAEWAHPAALILLSATGVVTRYVYGIEFDPMILRESIYKAGLAEPATAVGFLLRCYHYDPDANSHARAGVTAMRVGAAASVVLLFGALGVMHRLRRSKRPSPAVPNGVT